VIRGTPADVGTWPEALAEMPPNLAIRREAESGDGQVVEDFSEDIDAFLAEYNGRVPAPVGMGGEGGMAEPEGSGGTTSAAGTSQGGSVSATGGSNNTGATNSAGQGPDGEAGEPASEMDPDDDGCSCRVAGHAGDSAGGLALLGLAALSLARRRRR
jgi:MYXO-CTERM domain-containing protein